MEFATMASTSGVYIRGEIEFGYTQQAEEDNYHDEDINKPPCIFKKTHLFWNVKHVHAQIVNEKQRTKL